MLNPQVLVAALSGAYAPITEFAAAEGLNPHTVRAYALRGMPSLKVGTARLVHTEMAREWLKTHAHPVRGRPNKSPAAAA